MKTNSTVIAACIGAVTALIAAYVGYQIGEKQNELDRTKLLAGLITEISTKDTPVAWGIIVRLCNSKILRPAEAENLAQTIFKKPCPKT